MKKMKADTKASGKMKDVEPKVKGKMMKKHRDGKEEVPPGTKKPKAMGKEKKVSGKGCKY